MEHIASDGDNRESVHNHVVRKIVNSSSLDSLTDPFITDADGRNVVYFPSPVLASMDNIARDARRQVKRTALAFASGKVEGVPLPTIDPTTWKVMPSTPDITIYAIPATNSLFLLARHGHEQDKASVVVEDIVTRALWERLRHDR